MTLIDEVWLKSLAYPSGEEGGKFLVQMISTCLRYRGEEGGRGSAPCGKTPESSFQNVIKWRGEVFGTDEP